jgi:putative copper export protein
MTPETAAVLLAGCRWALYVAVLALVGVAGARHVLRRAGSGALAPIAPMLEQRLVASLTPLTAFWMAALLGTLAINVIAWFGPGGLTDPERYQVMLSQTSWGRSWARTFIAAAAALALAIAARFARPVAPAAVTAAAAAAVLPTPLIGHAAGHGTLIWALHATHLAGAGLWLGTVMLVAWQTWPLWRDVASVPGALSGLLRAITPVALTGAGIAVGSGVWLAIYHVWPPQTTFDTAYGTTLAVKTVVVALIGVLGWLNWRRFGPRSAVQSADRRRLRQSLIAEMMLAFVVVLALTAWLSGLPMPM